MKFFKYIGYIGLLISALWLIEWYSIEKLDISLIGMTGYFPFSQIVLISVLSHISTIASNRTAALPYPKYEILDDNL